MQRQSLEHIQSGSAHSLASRFPFHVFTRRWYQALFKHRSLLILLQVGLIVINVIGSTSSLSAASATSAAAVSSAAGGGISPLDDLTCDLNFDPVTATVSNVFTLGGSGVRVCLTSA